jgi:hypothetical protein
MNVNPSRQIERLRFGIAVLALVFAWAASVSAAPVVFLREKPLPGFPDTTFVIAADDLINLGAPSFSGQSNSAGASNFGSDPTGIAMNNGSFLDDSPSFGNTEAGRTFAPIDGSSLTFDLDVSAEPGGYTVGSFSSIAGGAQERRSQKFRFEYSVVGDAGFVVLADETQLELLTGGGNGESLIFVTDDGGAPLATGVDQIRVTYFDTPSPAAFTVSMYRELDVYADSKSIDDIDPPPPPPPIGPDTSFTDTVQVRAAGGGNGPFGGSDRVVAAVNFTNASASPVGGNTLLGIEFDDVSIVPSGLPADGLFETFSLSANGSTAQLETRFRFIHVNNDQGGTVLGTDAAAANAMLRDVHVISAPRADGADDQEFTLTGLDPDTTFFVQLFGGDGGWNGQLEVVANGVSHMWTTASDGNVNTASQLNFIAMSDPDGKLDFDLNQSDPLGVGGPIFAGLSGFIVTQVPEPGSASLTAIALLGVLGVGRRRSRKDCQRQA